MKKGLLSSVRTLRDISLVRKPFTPLATDSWPEISSALSRLSYRLPNSLRHKINHLIIHSRINSNPERVIITSDNPRFEEPQEIINDMLAGLDAEDMKKTLSIADRKEAIRTACMLAEKGDVILVAGKGHENYQEIKGVKHHFDDKEVLKEIFN